MTTSPATRARILIVDDSPFEQRLLADLLAERDYLVSSAYNGRQGYEVAASARPDLILLDVRMPYMDGYAACRLLKANPDTQDIPVIFVSGADAEDERVFGLSVGAVDFVTKPFSGPELAARIQVHLSLMRRAAAPAPAGRSDDAEPDMVLVNAARRLIDDDLANVPSLDDIAEQVGTYREKLSLLFRERMGTTVFAYIRDQRLERGARLLRDTDIDVQGIALMVGFNNAGNFATAFRERVGVPPSAYRKASMDGNSA
ncbi:response regulator [Massilia violaceinigra]|uniref:Response regulator n=1 Tax=Massilia violaceinigra TaxID=2045208 RepID=A0ABY3ZZN3_9BURK|nr:response regulator [Massilia violaceinigra]